MRAAVDVVLGERYRLEERIATGGMGEVWRARDVGLGREVAVKILRPEYAQDPLFHARFRGEARHAAALSHPGIAAVYDYGEADDGDGCPYLVMELVEGQPLSQLIVRDAPFSPERTLDVIAKTARALQAAHDIGVVHRDVKPGNLLIGPDGTVKVTDFGIARAVDAVPMTRTGQVMGTAQYLSPEQAAGSSATPLSDVYALGVVAYECLAGRRPFDGESPVSVALAQVREEPPALPDDVPAAVRGLVMGMLAKDPSQRPQSAGAVAEAAEALRTSLAMTLAPTALMPPIVDLAPSTRVDVPVPEPEPGPPPAGGRRRRMTPLWTTLAMLAVLALLVLVRACSATSDTSDQPGPSGSTSPSGPVSGSTAPATGTSGTPTLNRFVTVRADRYLGRPVDDVVAELEARGLAARVRTEEGDGRPGTVMGVTPTGRVAVGSTVTVTAVAAKGDGERTGKGKGKG